MKGKVCIWLEVSLLTLVSAVGIWAQQRPESDEEASRRGRGLVTVMPESPSRAAQAPSELVPTLAVPRLIKFAGTLKDAQGKPRTGVTGLTFAIYKDQEGGAPLWLETQNVELDQQGHYTVLLGATRPEGLSLELFSSGEPRWLGVQVQLPGEVEQPRVLLVSVPYALKAADAETLGGLPASAFVLAAPTGTASGTAGASPSGTTTTRTTSKTAGKATAPAGATAPAANFISEFTNGSGTLGSSVIFQDPTTNNIGVGTTSPAAALHVQGDTLLVNGVSTPTGTAQVLFEGVASEARFGQDFNGAFFASDTPGKAVRFYTNNGTLNEGLRVTSSSNVGIGTTTPAFKLDVQGNTTAFNTAIVAGTQGGSNPAAFSFSPTTIPPAAVGGISTATTGTVAGVGGISNSSSGAGVGALNFSSTGGTGLFAAAAGAGSTGVTAFAVGTSGSTIGVHAGVMDSTGAAAVLDNDAAGNIVVGRIKMSGVTGHVNVFRVDGTGKGFFNGGTQTGGADFAEAVAVRGERLKYEPGDVLVVDRAAGRRLMLSRRAYSTRVAGIYSTKPGVLATTHFIDDSEALAEEVPVAIVGIVPCKVTAENGPIAPGDLLVTSSTAGYAMRGTNRTRMLGAVVGKALEPLRQGKGVIQVLVTLQ